MQHRELKHIPEIPTVGRIVWFGLQRCGSYDGDVAPAIVIGHGANVLELQLFVFGVDPMAASPVADHPGFLALHVQYDADENGRDIPYPGRWCWPLTVEDHGNAQGKERFSTLLGQVQVSDKLIVALFQAFKDDIAMGFDSAEQFRNEAGTERWETLRRAIARALNDFTTRVQERKIHHRC